jgi:hypothetical protein
MVGRTVTLFMAWMQVQSFSLGKLYVIFIVNLCCLGAGTVSGTGTGTGYGIFRKTKIRVRPYNFF